MDIPLIAPVIARACNVLMVTFHFVSKLIVIWVIIYDVAVVKIRSKKRFVESSLREKCPNTKFFLVRILPHPDWIRRDTKYLSVLSPNAGKYGPEKTPYLNTFHTVVNSDSLGRELSSLRISSLVLAKLVLRCSSKFN